MFESLSVVSPREMGLAPSRWENVLKQARGLCESGEMPALSLQIQRQGLTTGVHAFGSRSASFPAPVDQDTCFLVASLTKPVLAMAVLTLVEDGKLGLNQRAVEFIPEFHEAAKKTITIRHLLAHTSGLPDMLPHNQKLRMEKSPLSRFVEGTCGVTLDFPPGRGSQYQSMGYALLGEILTRVSGMPYGQFVRERIFEPLRMKHSWLGLPGELYGTIPLAEVVLPEEQVGGSDWNWNSRYWQSFGAPWGGMICTVGDLSLFCRMMLDDGLGPNERLFSTTTIRLATTNRLGDFENVPEFDRRARGWGLGWRMNWPDHRGTFGDLLSDSAYGHWGATGTLYWIDPQRDMAAVLISTQPLGKEQSPLTRLSNAIVAAFE